MEITRSINCFRLMSRSFSLKKLFKGIQPVIPILAFQAHSDAFAKEKLAAHQKKVMAKGLPKQKPIVGVKNVILVVSGKGGVGKSTTSVNIATALAEVKSTNVGLLDADVFGPSIPLMIGLNESPQLSEDNKMIPPIKYGVKWISCY